MSIYLQEKEKDGFKVIMHGWCYFSPGVEFYQKEIVFSSAEQTGSAA